MVEYAPKGDAGNLTAMAVIDFEEVQIALFYLLGFICGQTVSIRIELLLILKVLFYACTAEFLRTGQGIEVQCGHHHLHTTSGKRINAGLIFLEIGIVHTIVTLHTYSIDSTTYGLEMADELADACTSLRIGHGVIIIV